ncbi:DJ-1/PfpI family protein [Alloalcanivorax xenomutans]|jgi:cyclohexyl-isocyanide hydratase|uniref:DJ-1/PfpI family protein n=1 Tax=Alloalcanivorax xenomutans TaxID=1094342 RepID=UPI0003B8C122|nr:thiazole biosynthesis protein ThiJ [Alcanivorax sp. PN-3]KYZ84792.1 thiamine biosynthesis protein ThiJ [Alcanivorax sp. KX64203]MBA4721557.1 DJ-1/PfpI family protein [Alcanivorax sp.]
MTQTLNIVFAVYDDVTHLDFTGPHMFFARLPGARIQVASLHGDPVHADGLVFAELAALTDIPHCDVLCVPGGLGCMAVMEDQAYLSELRRLAASARYLTSVCTGSLILGAAGLLSGKRAACHWAWRDMLGELGAIADPERVVRDGNLITGGGVTAGIDFALTVIEELAGADVAQSIQLGLEYAPQPPFNAGRPETAPAPILNKVNGAMAAAMPARWEATRRAARRLSQDK